MTRNQLLNMALTTVTEERQDPYGEPEDSFGTIASFWSAYLAARRCGSDLRPFDVAAMMALLKIARIAHSGGTNDDGCHTNHKTGDYHCH
jgi:hypothetical protein